MSHATSAVRISPSVMMDDTGATIEVSGTVEEKLGGGRLALALTARSAGAKILSRVRAVVQLPAARPPPPRGTRPAARELGRVD
jgi:hypothetical protein